MAGVFSNQVVTAAGRNLIASATATNQIVFVKALSASTVPTDPGDNQGYDGLHHPVRPKTSPVWLRRLGMRQVAPHNP